MTEGRLAPVRETDRHAALIAGCAGALCSASTLALLRLLGLETAWRGTPGDSLAVVVVAASLCGFVVGAAEGAVASRMARQAAGAFQPLPLLAARIGKAAAIVNVVVAFIGVSLSFDGEQRIVALILSTIVAVAASFGAAAVFAWSHAVDWPSVPEFIRQTGRRPESFDGRDDRIRDDRRAGPTERRLRERNVSQDAELDYEAGRNEVVNEPRSRSRRRTAEEDEVWAHPQDLISGR